MEFDVWVNKAAADDYRLAGKLVEVATDFARALMEGDAATFKAGYSADNALIAAIEQFGLSHAGAAEVAEKIGADETKVGYWVERYTPKAVDG